MLNVCPEKHELFADKVHRNGNYYFTVTLGDELCAALAVQRLDGDCGAVHMEVPEWDRPRGKEVVKDFKEFAEFLKGVGINTLIVTNEDLDMKNERKWTKFIALFGFPKPTRFFSSMREI